MGARLGHHFGRVRRRIKVPMRTEPHWLWRDVRRGVPVILCAALLSTAIYRQPFGRMLIYSLCIGIPIQGLIEFGRTAIAAWLRRRNPDQPAAQRDWPGWRWMAPWILVSGFVGYYGGFALANWITGAGLSGSARDAIDNPYQWFLVTLWAFAFPLGAVYYFSTRNRLAVLDAQAQAALRIAAEHRLALLASQLEPHMLFNTLANLRVLIGVDPSRAQAMLDHLIVYLRATLDGSRTAVHALSTEFARVGDYLALMAVRMGPRLHSHLDLPADLADCAVPSLLLQPLVENAIKHGLEPTVAGGRIEVTAQRVDDRLVLSVRDTGRGLAALTDGLSGGFGVRQVEERLATLYGTDARFDLRAADDGAGGVVATVRLPLAHLPTVGIPAAIPGS